ncbi:MAG: DUF222 domain-containing protein [Microbacterium sp.]
MLLDAEILDIPIPDALDHVIEVADMMSIFAAQRLRAVDAMRREALEEAAARGRVFTDVVERGIRLELAAALRITEFAAAALISLAEALLRRYPEALASLERAAVTERHVEILSTALEAIEPELRAALLPRALAIAESEPVGTFRRSMRKLIETARSVDLAERHEAALGARRASVEQVEDGMSWLNILGPTVEVQAAYDRATAIAKVIVGAEGETRTLDQVRADVLCDVLIEGTVADHPEAARGIRARVVVTVPALALLCDDDAERAAAGLDPAVVEGIGPIPLPRAKQLCGGDARWMRVLTHPETAMVLSVGREQYSPPASLRRLVRWRADRCMAPGCGMPASRCEIDHNVDWAHGGSTSLTNLAPFCKGHHIVKHHGGWEIRQLPDGAVEWTSPTGRRYMVRPDRPMPTFRPSDETATAAPF